MWVVKKEVSFESSVVEYFYYTKLCLLGWTACHRDNSINPRVYV